VHVKANETSVTFDRGNVVRTTIHGSVFHSKRLHRFSQSLFVFALSVATVAKCRQPSAKADIVFVTIQCSEGKRRNVLVQMTALRQPECKLFRRIARQRCACASCSMTTYRECNEKKYSSCTPGDLLHRPEMISRDARRARIAGALHVRDTRDACILRVHRRKQRSRVIWSVFSIAGSSDRRAIVRAATTH
jgi:hypothetical protein